MWCDFGGLIGALEHDGRIPSPMSASLSFHLFNFFCSHDGDLFHLSHQLLHATLSSATWIGPVAQPAVLLLTEFMWGLCCSVQTQYGPVSPFLALENVTCVSPSTALDVPS